MSPSSILRYINTANIKNALFHIRTFGFRSVLRKTFDYLEFTRNYNIWRVDHTVTEAALSEQRSFRFSYEPLFSIIVPVYRTPELFLRQMIESVTAQTYPNWELCIADGSSDASASYITDIVSEYQQKYPNIRYQLLKKNLGISGNTNVALDMASGDFVALLDHDDILTPDALYEVASALNRHPDYEVLYTDEDKVDTDLKNYYDPYFKPDFNLDLLRSCNYITHFFIVKTQLAKLVGGFSDECNGSQDYDFILKTCEKASSICHISKVLYHWRIHPASVAGDPENKTYAYDSAVRALQNHLERCKADATATKDAQYGYYRISYGYIGKPLLSICLMECSPELPRQIKSDSTYQAFEFVSSPAEASGEYLVFLYHVKKVLSPDWLEQLLGNCSRKEIGAAGIKTFFRKGKILDYGLIYTSDGQIHSPFRRFNDLDTGYCYRARIQQCSSLISPYCFMTKRTIWTNHSEGKEYSDFSEQVFRFCHRLTEQGYQLTLIPYCSVVTDCSQPSLPILDCYKEKSDPFYNPNFSDTNMYHLS